MQLLKILAILIAASLLPAAAEPPPAASEPSAQPERLSMLVFSRTAGFRHDSIVTAVEAIIKLAAQNGYNVHATEHAGVFTPEKLKDFNVVIFLNTTGTILNDDQKVAFQQFIRGGGGFVGVHAAADTEYDWPWYGNLVGAYFKSHPHIQQADIIIEDHEHPATRHLPRRDDGEPARWTRTDEWYDFRTSPRGHAIEGSSNFRVLLSLDESTYQGGRMGDDHPIAWCHEFDGGRAFYTGLGHTRETFKEPEFLQHLLGAIRWAAGRDASQRSEPEPMRAEP
jgi:type 1 glutamine amidotransferase